MKNVWRGLILIVFLAQQMALPIADARGNLSSIGTKTVEKATEISVSQTTPKQEISSTKEDISKEIPSITGITLWADLSVLLTTNAKSIMEWDELEYTLAYENRWPENVEDASLEIDFDDTFVITSYPEWAKLTENNMAIYIWKMKKWQKEKLIFEWYYEILIQDRIWVQSTEISSSIFDHNPSNNEYINEIDVWKKTNARYSGCYAPVEIVM